MNILSKFYRKFFPIKQEIYIGETPLFNSGQTTIEKYTDYETIGEYGGFTLKDDGSYEPIDNFGGKMLSRTVKFKGKDGVIKLGRDWVPDNDKSVTGFDASSLEG